MARVIKLGVQRPATGPLLPDPEPRPVRYTLISVDDHLVEPPEAFEDRLPRKFAGQAPRVVETEEGHEVWLFEPVEEQRMISHENAAKLYRHPLPEKCVP